MDIRSVILITYFPSFFQLQNVAMEPEKVGSPIL
jgi:hypothetical protein